MVADCRAQGPALWIPHAVGTPFMTPVRGHGGGLSCARSGVVDSACRGGPFMTPVRGHGGGLSGVRSGVVDSACRGGAIYDARPRSWWRIVGVRSGGVAPFGCSGVINGAPTFLRWDGVRWCLYCVCAVRVFGRHKWRPYVFLRAGWEFLSPWLSFLSL